MIDTVLADRYRIQAKLGEGGMAVVYRAMDVILRRVVAIKVLRPQYAGDQEFVDRFRREAQAAASLSHPNVVNIFDVGQADDVHYIVLEYVQGQNLKEIVRAEGRLMPRRAAQIARSVARALEAAHACGLIHRDIKPHNILITLEGRVKVTDFGLARATSAATLTETGIVIGSVHYFSPEQARGQAVGPASDIYSLGVVLYEMLTGTVPFQGDSPIAVALKHLQEPPVPPRERYRQIPVWLEQVVLRALAKDPQERFRSAAEMAEALEWRVDTPAVPAAAEAAAGRADRGSAEPRGFNTGGRPADDGSKAGDSDGELSRELRRELRRELQRELHGIPVRGGASRPPTTDVAAASDDDAPRRKSTRLRKWLSVLLVLAVLAGAVYIGTPYVLALVFPPEVVVPDVIGLSYEQARPLMEEAGLILEIEAEQFHRDMEPGLILRQNPVADRIVRRGRNVRIVLSRGPELGVVPDVTARPLREARIALTQAGYTLGDEFDDFTEDVPVNFVLAQDPAPGTEAERGTPVNLWISRPTTPSDRLVTVPDFRGRDMDQAVEELTRLGLAVGNRWPEMRPLVPAGLVLDQNPKPDTVVEPGTTIDFVYSEGLPGAAVQEPSAAPGPGVVADEGAAGIDWETMLSDDADARRRRARIDIEVPPGRAQEVVILIIDDFGAREVYRAAVPGGTTLHEFVEGRGEHARLQVYVGGTMYMDELFPD